VNDLTANELTTIIAGLIDTPPEKLTGWLIIVQTRDEDGREGILVCSPANVEHVDELAARAANVYALSSALTHLTRGYLQAAHPEYVQMVLEAEKEMMMEFVCEECKLGMHFRCISPCDCQHREGESDDIRPQNTIEP
jgi:hypothetical protein